MAESESAAAPTSATKPAEEQKQPAAQSTTAKQSAPGVSIVTQYSNSASPKQTLNLGPSLRKVALVWPFRTFKY